MIFQNPDIPDVYPPGYYYGIDFPIWIISLIVGLVGSIIFVKRSKGAEMDSQKALYLGIGLLYFFITIMRIMYLVAVRYSGITYDLSANLGYIFQLIGMTCLIFNAEKVKIINTKFIFTIFSITGILVVGLSLFEGIEFIDRDISRLYSTAVSSINTIIILSIYFNLVLKNNGIIRKRMLIGFIGILLLFVGSIIDSEIFYGLWAGMPIILSPIIYLFGLSIVIYQQRPWKSA